MTERPPMVCVACERRQRDGESAVYPCAECTRVREAYERGRREQREEASRH